MSVRASTALVAVTLAFVAGPASSAASKQVSTLRVMLSPATAARGTLDDATRARLEKLAGAPLARTASTRTGALELAVGGPRALDQLDAIAKRLRTDRSVLWAEAGSPSRLTLKSRTAEDNAPGRKLLVRLQDGVAADWNALLPRLSAQAGSALAVERAIGNVWVLALPSAVATSQLDAMAQAVEQDPAIRYADAVRRMRIKSAPNDAYFAQQWSLTDVTGGINMASAWALGTGSAAITVAVVDTGITDHPDLAGRILPGYNFISDPASARNSAGRGPDAHDNGDWIEDGDCGGFPAEASSWHGTFVSGLIAANANNEIGIAGANWASKIVPVRALGRCGGTTEDVLAALMWAAGVPVEGAPANPNPAKVINMSLGGYGTCAGALQEAVDDALAQGTIVVVAAGNETDDASNYAPAGCGGVITVGATARSGDRSGYSNFGRRVDLSAPGGDGFADDGLMISLSNDGAREPGAPSYSFGAGTSAAAPLVTGAVSLMLARNPNLTAGQLLTILQGATREFPLGTSCYGGHLCGAGLLDVGTAVTSTLPAIVDLPPGAVAIVEYYDAALDHYLITADPVEMAQLDMDARWARTGHVFYGYADPESAPPGVTLVNVCRFYAGPPLIDSYFYTADGSECNFLINNGNGVWQLVTPTAFFIELPDGSGACRSGTLPVYRFFNNRRDASQRFTIDLSVRRAMINRAWIPDGPGQNGTAFCSAI